MTIGLCNETLDFAHENFCHIKRSSCRVFIESTSGKYTMFYEKYIDLRPNDLDSLQDYALYLAKLARWKEAAEFHRGRGVGDVEDLQPRDVARHEGMVIDDHNANFIH